MQFLLNRLNKIPLKNFTDTLSKDRDIVGRKINPVEISEIKCKEIFFSFVQFSLNRLIA